MAASSAEAEYYAYSSAVKDLEYVTGSFALISMISCLLLPVCVLHDVFILIIACITIANSSLLERLLALTLFGIVMDVKCIAQRLLLLIVCLSKNSGVSCAVNT